MATVTRAKFRCASVEPAYNDGRTYRFTAVTDSSTPENERYARYTPSGALTITVDNPNVEFTIGTGYYLDFTPVDGE